MWVNPGNKPTFATCRRRQLLIDTFNLICILVRNLLSPTKTGYGNPSFIPKGQSGTDPFTPLLRKKTTHNKSHKNQAATHTHTDTTYGRLEKIWRTKNLHRLRQLHLISLRLPSFILSAMNNNTQRQNLHNGWKFIHVTCNMWRRERDERRSDCCWRRRIVGGDSLLEETHCRRVFVEANKGERPHGKETGEEWRIQQCGSLKGSIYTHFKCFNCTLPTPEPQSHSLLSSLLPINPHLQTYISLRGTTTTKNTRESLRERERARERRWGDEDPSFRLIISATGAA